MLRTNIYPYIAAQMINLEPLCPVSNKPSILLMYVDCHWCRYGNRGYLQRNCEEIGDWGLGIGHWALALGIGMGIGITQNPY
ncbi:MAG: hypothetical protein HC903_15550, partial [Methylacidiphilales bacterium]|nr:hypothetical protein [Candidatus Methylacidiphilales bacterium]